MLKDDQDYYYNGGGDAKLQKTWSDFSTMQYMKFGGKVGAFRYRVVKVVPWDYGRYQCYRYR